MPGEAAGYPLRQLDTAWKLARFHLAGLTTAECLWRPGPAGPHVHRAADGYARFLPSASRPRARAGGAARRAARR